MNTLRHLSPLQSFIWAVSACCWWIAGGQPLVASDQDGGRATTTINIPNQRIITPDLVTGGQPTSADLQRAADEGFRTIVSLRPTSELEWDEQAAVAALDMNWVHIPIASKSDLTVANARQLEAALTGPPVLVHCASGNRVGALLAIKAFMIDGASAEAALDFGDKAGLTSLRPVVEGLFESLPVSNSQQ